MFIKKKELDKLKSDVEYLHKQVDVLNFKLKYGENGIHLIRQMFPSMCKVQYLDQDELCYINLPQNLTFTIEKDIIVGCDLQNKVRRFKIDRTNNILIEIEREVVAFHEKSSKAKKNN